MQYVEGTKVQRRDGHIFIKTHTYGLIKEARYIVMMSEDRALDRNERVFFKDGNRENVHPRNVVPIHFSEIRFKYLPHARVIYVPKSARATARIVAA